MNPYSHIVIAAKLAPYVRPDHPAEYYWGAVVPDARYLASMKRHSTHLSPHRIMGLMQKHPHLKSFLQGYLVHCLSDEIDLRTIFFQHFPFSVVKRRLSMRRVAVFLELFYFENEPDVPRIAGTYNELLSGLGLSEGVCARYWQGICQYTLPSSPQVRIASLFELLGIATNPRMDRYLSAGRVFQQNWLLREALFFGIRAGRISDQIKNVVASSLQEYLPLYTSAI